MIPTKSFKLVLILVLLGCATQSCLKDAIDLEQDDIQSSKTDDNIPYGETLILGKQLENPKETLRVCLHLYRRRIQPSRGL